MNNKSKYKDSPLGKIPWDWEVKLFGEVFEYINTPSFSRENLTTEKTKNEIYYIHYGDIHATYNSEILDFELENRVPFLKDEFYRENFSYLKDGDLVIADASEDYKGIGSSIEIRNIRDKKVIGGLHTLVARDNSSLTINGFRTYIFRNPYVHNEIKRIATGISVYGISKSNLASLKLPLPTLPEQTRIAELLDTWDKAISNLQSTIEQVELRNKGLMQELLTGRRRLKGFLGKWKEVKMKDVFERVVRKNSENNTNVVTISAQRGFVRQTDFFNKNIASEITDNYFLVEKGEFCYNKSYSNGYPWGATKRLNDYEKAVVTTLYICFKIKNEKKNSGDYFEQYFNQNMLDRGLTKIAHEGGRAHGLLNVTPSDFFDLKISIPSIEEQTELAQILHTAEKEVCILQNKLYQLKAQKKWLTQVMLTGRIRLLS